MKKIWTDIEDHMLETLYPDNLTDVVAEKIGCTVSQVHRRAFKLKIKKSDVFFSRPDCGRLDGSTGNKFKKGSLPWNTGMKGLRTNDGSTWFKNGSVPWHKKPIGSEHFDKDGVILRKVYETGIRKVDWVGAHILLWVEHNGPVPDGCVVVFKDGNKSKIDIENIECITRSELMARNSVPKELSALVQLRGVLNRQINRRNKNEQK